MDADSPLIDLPPGDHFAPIRFPPRGQQRVLRALALRSTATLHELARDLKMTPATTQTHLSRLRRAYLITALGNRPRVNNYTLTPFGHACLRAIATLRLAYERTHRAPAP